MESEVMVELSDWFEPPQLLAVVERLLDCHRDPDLFALNDWHFLILYHVLYEFVAIHNDLVDDRGPVDVGGCLVGEIDFGSIIGIFFWDTDFLTDPDVFNKIPRQLRSSEESSLEWMDQQGLDLDPVNNLGFSDELFGIVNRLAPHPEELGMVRVSDESAVEPVEEIFEAGQGYPHFRDE
jgi:hypothetical protein